MKCIHAIVKIKHYRSLLVFANAIMQSRLTLKSTLPMDVRNQNRGFGHHSMNPCGLDRFLLVSIKGLSVFCTIFVAISCVIFFSSPTTHALYQCSRVYNNILIVTKKKEFKIILGISCNLRVFS